MVHCLRGSKIRSYFMVTLRHANERPQSCLMDYNTLFNRQNLTAYLVWQTHELFSSHIWKYKDSNNMKVHKFQIWELNFQQKFHYGFHEYFSIDLNFICAHNFQNRTYILLTFLLQTLGKGEKVSQFGNHCVNSTDCHLYQRRPPPLIAESLL